MASVRYNLEIYLLLSITKDSEIKDSFENIEKTPLEENTKANLYLCATLLSELKYPKDLIKRIIKEDIMIKSQILNEYIEKERLEGLSKSVISVLRARFNRVPRRISNKIKTIKKETKLEHLLKIAAVSKDLEEFEKNLE